MVDTGCYGSIPRRVANRIFQQIAHRHTHNLGVAMQLQRDRWRNKIQILVFFLCGWTHLVHGFLPQTAEVKWHSFRHAVQWVETRQPQ